MNTENKMEKSSFNIFQIVWPIIIYYLLGIVAQIIYMFSQLHELVMGFVEGNPELFTTLIGSFTTMGEEMRLKLFLRELNEEIYIEFIYFCAEKMLLNAGLLAVIAAGLGIPVLGCLMLRDWNASRKVEEIRAKKPFYTYIWVVIGAILLCLAMNLLIALSGLMEASESYEGTSEALYNMSFIFQIIGLGVVVPLAEEILYRGLIFRRLEKGVGAGVAVVVSSIIFATVHGNIVQFIYALVCGLAFAWLYKEFNTLMAPVLAHCVMNLTSVLMTEIGMFNKVMEEISGLGIPIVIAFTLVSVCYVMIDNSQRKGVK